VSKGGNLLLNIGPKADGTIPDGDRKILEDLAAWMRVNGEAIHSARTWRKFREGPTFTVEGQFQDRQEIPYTSEDYRFTVTNGALYAIAMACPEDGRFTVKALADSKDQNIPEFHGIISKVEILGHDGSLEWKKDGEGLHISAPGFRSDMPAAIKVTIE
jgi:alpha-L-fucosidase